MNTIKIYLATSGRIADLKKDFPLYQGQFQNKLLNIFVPTSILAPDFKAQSASGDITSEYVAGTAVKIGMTYTQTNGKIKTSKNYYMNYLKTLTYQNVEYALFERKLPKEFTLYTGVGANAPTLIANVVNVETDAETPKVLSIITSQTCKLDVMPSASLDNDEAIEATALEEINASINAINAILPTKQNVQDDALQTTAKSVVGAINENKGRIDTNATSIVNNTESIAKNRNDIDFLQENMQLSQRYIGRMSGTALPTDAQLTQFVRDTTASDPANGDTIIFVQVIPNATDKVFKYFYSATKWQNYEIPAIESAQNGSLGSVQGTYSIGDTADTLVDISGGKILNIYVLDGTGTYRNIVEYLNSTSENVAKIVNGDTFVGNALRAVADGVGNNIVDTYLTKALGATKTYVRDYAMPREFNDVDFIASTGFVDEVPTTPASGVQFTTSTSAVGDATLFDIEKTNKADFELSSKNGSSNNIYVSCDKAITATFRLTTAYKRSTLEWQDLSIELTEPITFTAGEIQKLTFGAPFTALGQAVVKLTDGDKIKQTLEVISTTSTALTWNVYSNDTYPSTFNLTSQSYTMGALDALQGVHIQLGADGVIEANRAVFTVADAESYETYRTNGREFLLNLHLPISVAKISDLDQTLPVAITFGDTTYNLYNYQLGATTPLTIGNIMSVARYDASTGFTFDFKATYFENAEIVGFGIIPSAITATQLDLITTTGSGLNKTLNGTKLNIDLAESTKNTLTTNTSDISDLKGRTEAIENSYVAFTEQELTDAQKAQARSNIGAGDSAFSGKYGDLKNIPTLNSTSDTSLEAKANEQISGEVKLHKIAKTGALADAVYDPQHTTLTEVQRTQISTNATNIATNTADIATNATNIATNAENIAKNTAKIGENSTAIETNKQNIATAQNDINTLKATDVEHGESIETNTSDIATLKSKTETIENAYISYASAQELTDEQKAQARTNIGAGSSGFGGTYGELAGKPTLDTTSAATLATSASETINGSVKLHKVAKTGKLADLITDSTHTTLTEAQRTQIGTNTTNIGTNATNIDTLQSGLATAEQEVADNMTAIGTINGKIPTQATTTNQLADKDFVNSSINSIAAFYITANAAGDAFETYSALESATTFYSAGKVRTPTQNDYCIVRKDENHDDATTRYIYQAKWQFQYVVNETALTAAQIAAINSNITAELVGQITTNKNDISTLKSTTTTQGESITQANTDIANLQTADAQNVKLTGDQSIAGAKNFTGTFQINGGTITYDASTNTFNF